MMPTRSRVYLAVAATLLAVSCTEIRSEFSADDATFPPLLPLDQGGLVIPAPDPGLGIDTVKDAGADATDSGQEPEADADQGAGADPDQRIVDPSLPVVQLVPANASAAPPTDCEKNTRFALKLVTAPGEVYSDCGTMERLTDGSCSEAFEIVCNTGEQDHGAQPVKFVVQGGFLISSRQTLVDAQGTRRTSLWRATYRPVARGDCNVDDMIDCRDVLAISYEISDSGSDPSNTAAGKFAGSPLGCDFDANQLVTSLDLVLLINKLKCNVERGDCNVDGRVDEDDLERIFVETFETQGTANEVVTGEHLSAPAGCDVNGDGTVGASDASALQLKLNGVNCPDDEPLCDGSCVNLQINRQNCGECGRPCVAGQACVSGGCLALDEQ